jgi:ABC-2 type transport system permease protein
VIALLRTEWAKVLRRPRTYVALGLVVVVPIIIGVALWANPPSPGRGDGPRFFVEATRTGLLFPAAALNIMSRFLLIVVIALFAGDAIAGEAGTGNLRYLLVRPIERGRLLAAKAVVATSLGAIAAVLLAASAAVVGGIAFGFKPLDLANGFVHQSVGELLGHTALATLFVFWTLSSVIAFGFMISTMTESGAAAAGSALAFGVVAEILDGISSLGGIRHWLPFRHFEDWHDLFVFGRWTDDMWKGVLLPLPYVVAFCGFAWYWFRRKDVTT